MEASQSSPAILRLPEEILGLILSYASTGPPRRHILLSNVSLTCKCFNRISRPFFFEQILIEQGSRPGLASSAKVIHSHFQKHPSLRVHCKDLALDINYLSRNDHSRIVDLLNWLTNVRYLGIRGSFTNPEPDQPSYMPDDDPLFEYEMKGLLKLVVQRMGRLQVLCCNSTSRDWGVKYNGANFMRDIDIPSLEKLVLFGLGRSDEPPCSNKVWRR